MNKAMGSRFRYYLGLLALGLMASGAVAQEYPVRPVTILVWAEPGSPIDLYSRAMARLLTRELGQNVIVENRPGADGVIMINALLKAPADGYMIASNSLSLASLFGEPNINFKPDDLQMIARSQIDPYALIVPASIPFKTVDEFVKYARQHPGKITVGGAFEIGAHRVFWETFSQLAQIKTTWIPYKGGGPAMLAVAGGHVDAAQNNPGQAKPHVLTGKVRLLAVSSEQRLKDFPAVPTYKERGWDIVRYQWRGMMAKAGLPKPVLDRLVAAIQKAHQTPEWKAFLEQVVQLDGYMGPAEFKAVLLTDTREFDVTKKKFRVQQ